MLSLYTMWAIPGFMLGAFTVITLADPASKSWGILLLVVVGLFFVACVAWVAYDYTKKSFDIEGIYQGALEKWRKKKAAYLGHSAKEGDGNGK